MARARLLKPGFFTNDVLGEMPATTRLLFAGLWTLADRAGRLEDRPRRIKAEVLPYDDVDADAVLSSLTEQGFLVRYEVAGVRYIQIVNFHKHQSPHVREPESAIPAPDEHEASTVQAPDEHEASPSSRAHSPIPHSPFLKPIPEAETVTPPTPSPGKAAVAAATPNAAYRLFSRFCEEGDADEGAVPAGEKAKQLGIAKAILTEHTEDEAMGCAAFLRSQSWRTGLIDLGTVKSEIGRWKMAGSPAQERPRGSPASTKANGHRPVTFEEQREINNANNADEFDAMLRRYSDGPPAVPGTDGPPRRRLPG